MSDNLVSEIKRNHIVSLLVKNKRVDGRGFNEYREIKIEKNLIKIAEGSAQVSIGKTRVIAGVKMEVGEPYPDTPNTGVLSTNAEMAPISAPDFEPGPPTPTAVELARVVDRGIRESKMVNMEKLCIEEGKKVWMVFVDIHTLDYDGNLIDASALAAAAALMSAKVPAAQFGVGEDYPLPVQAQPVACTAVKIGNSILFDPSLDEENIASARLTVALNEKREIRAMQKGLPGVFTPEEIKTIINAAAINGEAIRNKLTHA